MYLVTQARKSAPWYEHTEIGYNYRMSNVVAGIGRGQLIHLEEHRSLKERIYMKYKEAFKDLPIKMNPYMKNDSRPNFWLSCLTINENCDVNYMHILNNFKKNNVEGRPIWKPMHMQPVFKNNPFVSVSDKSVSEDIFARGLCLPSDIKMTDEEFDYVVDLVKECFN